MEFQYILELTQDEKPLQSKDMSYYIVNELKKIQNYLFDNYTLYKYRHINIIQRLDEELALLTELKSREGEKSESFKKKSEEINKILTFFKNNNIELGTIESLITEKNLIEENINSEIDKIFEKSKNALKKDYLNPIEFKKKCYRFLTQIGDDPTNSSEYEKILQAKEQEILSYQEYAKMIEEKMPTPEQMKDAEIIKNYDKWSMSMNSDIRQLALLGIQLGLFKPDAVKKLEELSTAPITQNPKERRNFFMFGTTPLTENSQTNNPRNIPLMFYYGRNF